MITRDDLPPTPDWQPDCRCGQCPCVKVVPRTCIADMGDDERDQA